MKNDIDTVANLWKSGGGGCFTKKESLYNKLFKKHFPSFESPINVLEIGPGTGQFALDLHNKYNINSYTILDIESQIGSPRKLLTKNKIKNVSYVISDDFEDLYGKNFDILISNVCLPEVPPDYLELIGDNILPNCSNCFVIGNDGSTNPNYNNWVDKNFALLYRDISVTKSGYKNTLLAVGKKGGLI